MRLQDIDEKILAELKRIRSASGSRAREAGDERRTVRYFSTGPEPITIDQTGDNFEEKSFGLTAASVMVRTDQPLNIAFVSPFANGKGKLVAVRPDESPFVMGGDNPLLADKIFLQKRDGASGDANVQIQAIPP